MDGISARAWSVALGIAIVALTLTTAVIHYRLGGLLFLLNAAGYATLAVAAVATLGFLKPLRPLVLLALAGYTATTIIGWLVMGPYFELAYYTKAIEVVLIGVIGIELFRTRDGIVPGFAWLREAIVAGGRRVLRRTA